MQLIIFLTIIFANIIFIATGSEAVAVPNFLNECEVSMT